MNDCSQMTIAPASARESDTPPPGDLALVGLGAVALLTGAAVYALWRPGQAPTSAVVAVLAGSTTAGVDVVIGP